MTSSIKISTTIKMQGIREGAVIRQEIADVGQDIEQVIANICSFLLLSFLLVYLILISELFIIPILLLLDHIQGNLKVKETWLTVF